MTMTIVAPETAGVLRRLYKGQPPEVKAAIEAEVQRRYALRHKEQLRTAELLTDWRRWVTTMFPTYASFPFADHHVEFWEWVWSIEKGVRPYPFVAIWPRGGGKSSSAEMALVALGARRVRSYVWYCCETQDQADTHVANIADMLESEEIARYHPLLAEREVGKYGHSKAWRRNRLRTSSGFTVDAIGLDTARRGSRVKEKRPDLMVYDDIDGKHDTAATVKKKESTITTSLLPAGSADVATVMVQNIIHPNSVFAHLAGDDAEFLYDRYVSGPHPAIKGLAYETREDGVGYQITGGTATWEGQSKEIAEAQINDWGLSAFKQEAQHDVEVPPGGIWDEIEYRHIAWDDLPDFLDGAVWVDPAVTDKDSSDSHAVQAAAIDEEGLVYMLYSWERRTSPEDSIWRATLKALELGFGTVGIETDQGGDTWRSVYRSVLRTMEEIVDAYKQLDALEEVKEADRNEAFAMQMMAVTVLMNKFDKTKVGQLRQYAKALYNGKKLYPRFKSAKAGSGHGSKVERNALMLHDYERGKVLHAIGTHDALEAGLYRFPLTKPFDLVDAAYWAWADMRGKSKGVYF